MQLNLFGDTSAPPQYDHMPLAPAPDRKAEGERRKREGMRAAAQSKDSQLGYARELAAATLRIGAVTAPWVLLMLVGRVVWGWM